MKIQQTMADFHKITFSDEDYEKAAKQWPKQFLMMPLFSCADTLKYMTGMPGQRYKNSLATVEGEAQLAPYRHDRKSADSTNVIMRELETYFGNVCIDFEPNQYIQMLLGQSASFLGDGQAQAPSAKLVIACVMKSLGSHLNEVLFTAKRNPNGNTTKDLFDGWGTIIDKEITAGKISADEGNLLSLDEKVTSANAVDIAKEIERSCDSRLRKENKFLFCDPAFADAYNDAYLLTHAGISYNKQFDQPFVEGSGNKTTIVPLDCLAGTDKYIVTPKTNIVYGFDNMSDLERIEVKRFQPWVLTLAAAMFFGCQFYSIDKRYLNVVKLKADGSSSDQPGKLVADSNDGPVSR